MPRRIYFDNAATTPVSKPVIEAMLPYWTESFGNPSSTHSFGQEARKALFAARKSIADSIGALPEEILFTSGGTEADNWALRGAAYAKEKSGHIVTSAIEHHAVLNTCEKLAQEGFSVTRIKPDEDGVIGLSAVKDAIHEDTRLVSVMMANNETGAIQPIQEIGAFCREKGILFHTDAVQAVGALTLDLKELPVDLLSLSAHKLHGPKGIGALFIRKGLRIANLMEGGGQERGRRGGTENLPGIVGFAKALALAVAERERNCAYISALRDRLEQGILKLPTAHLNSRAAERLPGILNVSFTGIKPEVFMVRLDAEGVAVSNGSACAAGSPEPSHVLLAMGLTRELSDCSLRFSLGHQNTAAEVDFVVHLIDAVVNGK